MRKDLAKRMTWAMKGWLSFWVSCASAWAMIEFNIPSLFAPSFFFLLAALICGVVVVSRD